MKFGVVVFPGSNCDYDAERAVVELLDEPVEMLWHQSQDLCGCDAIILPGGFAHGDYLRAGAIARFSPIMDEVVKFATEGGTVIGICNGFQILTEIGLLEGALVRNRGLRFKCTEVCLRVESSQSRFTAICQKGELLHIPINHGLGSYYHHSSDIKKLEDNGQVLFRYVDDYGNATDESNPNGSLNNIAGILNTQGNVLGMMPHPERAVENILGSSDGLKIFNSIKNWAGAPSQAETA